MSLNYIGDLVLRLDSFRNIDLHRRGFYYYELSVFNEQDNVKTFASPYNYYVHGPSQPKHINGSPGFADDQVFKSKTFFIKYSDDDVEIDEIIVFRFETKADYLNFPTLTIKARLMICEANEIIDQNCEFKEESSGFVNINFYSHGLHQFVPLFFDRLHMCVLNSTIHVVPLGFIFRPERHVDCKLNESEFKLINSVSDYMFKGTVPDEQTKKFVIDCYLKLVFNGIQKLNVFLMRWKGNTCPVKGIEEIKSENPEEISQEILVQIQYYSELLIVAEVGLISILQRSGRRVAEQLMIEYNELVRDRWGESVFRNTYKADALTSVCATDLGNSHHKIAKKIRKSEYYQTVSPLPVTVTSLFPSAKIHPIIFLDITSQSPNPRTDIDISNINYLPLNQSYHLIILVHGFQANSLDMRCIGNQVSLIKSNTMLLCSSLNECKTDDDISKLGKRLAKEVLEYLSDWENSVVPTKISFIGHSMGGLIIRAALPHLQQISDKFSFFMTFSTPHLGYICNSSALVDAGMWFIKKFKKSLSMRQMTMTDFSDFRQTFIYKLSEGYGLDWFKHIAFISSFQDEYAPFESARVQIATNAESSKNGVIMKEMADNLLGKIRAQEVYRIDVDYKIEKANFDKLIGRAAHIEMLENESMIRMILYCCASFFD